MLVNKTSHKFTGKLGQKVDKTKCGHNYKIILLQIGDSAINQCQDVKLSVPLWDPQLFMSLQTIV